LGGNGPLPGTGVCPTEAVAADCAEDAAIVGKLVVRAVTIDPRHVIAAATFEEFDEDGIQLGHPRDPRHRTVSQNVLRASPVRVAPTAGW
jgi:hypothetical protein